MKYGIQEEQLLRGLSRDLGRGARGGTNSRWKFLVGHTHFPSLNHTHDNFSANRCRHYLGVVL